MKCLILASGFGTRLYPLTLNKAKALLEYKGDSVLSHIVKKIPEGIDIYVTVNKKFEKDFICWKKQESKNIELVVEDVWNEEQALGAVGSLWHAIQAASIDDDILVLAGDNYFEFSLNEFLNSYNGYNIMVAINDIGDKDKAVSFGVVSLEGSRIVDFEEKPARPRSSLVATACYILPARIKPLLKKYYSSGTLDNLGNFISFLVNEDEVLAHKFSDVWYDIGSLEVSELMSSKPGTNK